MGAMHDDAHLLSSYMLSQQVSTFVKARCMLAMGRTSELYPNSRT